MVLKGIEEDQSFHSLEKDAMEAQKMEAIERGPEIIIPSTRTQMVLTTMETLHLAQIHLGEAQRFLSLDKEAMEVQMMEAIERDLETTIRTTKTQIGLTMMETLHLTQIHPEEVQRFLSPDKKAMEVQMMEVIERALGPITRTM